MENKVELTGLFGDDFTHALSAWTSVSRDVDEEKYKRVPQLLKFLAENGHHTPFEKSYLQFLVTCDTASHIHFLKHRIGVSINGESARYKELIEDKYYIPSDWPKVVKKYYTENIENQLKYYHELLITLEGHGFDRKRAKESARFILPYANQLTLDVSFNFRSLMHFQGLRNKPDAQLEIREIAQKMLQLVKDSGEFTASLDAFGY